MSVSRTGSSTGPKIKSTQETDKVQAPRTEETEKPAAKGKPTAKAKSDSYDKATDAPKAESSVPGDPSKASGEKDGKIQRAAKKPSKGSVDMDAEVVKTGGKGPSRDVPSDPVEASMAPQSWAPPAPPGELGYPSNSSFGIGTHLMEATSFLQQLGLVPSSPSSAEGKMFAEVKKTTETYKAASLDYNNTVNVQGQQVLNDIETAKKNGTFTKMNEATGFDVGEGMARYAKAKDEAKVAYDVFKGVAGPEAEAAALKVDSANTSLGTVKAKGLKADAEKQKAGLESKIAEVKGYVDKGFKLADAIGKAALTGGAAEVAKYVLGEAKDTATGMAVDFAKDAVGDLLGSSEKKQLIEVQAQIQAYDDAIRGGKLGTAEADVRAAKAGLEAKMGAMKTAGATYINKQMEAWREVDGLKMMEDKYNKGKPKSQQSQVFENLQTYQHTAAAKGKALAEASSDYTSMLQKPPFAAGPDGKGIDPKKMAAEAASDAAAIQKGLPDGPDKDRALAEIGKLQKYANDLGSWVDAERKTAAESSQLIASGGQWTVTDAAIDSAFKAMGGTADRSKVVAPGGS